MTSISTDFTNPPFNARADAYGKSMDSGAASHS